MLTLPQASVAAAAAAAGTPVGLQPRFRLGGQTTNTGGVTSSVHVNVCVHISVLRQPSVAVYVLVCEREHPLDVIEPSDEVMLTLTQ